MDNIALGELIEKIGALIIQYEKSERLTEYSDEKATRLLKTKEVVKVYPALTIYSLNKAVKDELIPVVKKGNFNYFNKDDIENFIKIQTIKKGH